MTGPRFLFTGSGLTDDTYVMRAVLEGLNTQARQWSETVVIEDDGMLKDLEFEVEQFRHLRYRRVDRWTDPNIVLCFMDRLSHNRDSERTLAYAEAHGRPSYIISRYSDSEKFPPEP